MLLFWILSLVAALSLSKNAGEQPSKSLPSCQQFRLLIIWQTSSGEDPFFFQQRYFVIGLISNVTDGTEIRLTTVGTSLKYLLRMDKNSTDKSWESIIGAHKPENLSNHIIPHSLISKEIYSFLNKVGNQKRAEEILFVVNNKSVIDNIEKVKERLKYKILFVIFAGMSWPPEVWTNLATDKHHLFVLSDRHWESVKPVIKEVLILCCQDARLICDTDEYWTGKRCYKCAQICSIDTKYPYEMCLEECPYFASDRYASIDGDRSIASNQTVLVAVAVTVSPHFLYICIFLISIISSYLIYKLWKRKWSCKGKKTEEAHSHSQTEKQDTLDDESDNSFLSLDTVKNRKREVDQACSSPNQGNETTPCLDKALPTPSF